MAARRAGKVASDDPSNGLPVDRDTPREKSLHVICDNYATHKHAAVKAWLARRPRIHIHFTPTSASWLNMVERFFRDITTNAIRRGVFTSVHDLVDAVDLYPVEHNRDPKPFIWTASAQDILANGEEQTRRCLRYLAPSAS